MSHRDRAVLVLRYWEDRSVEAAAQMLRLSPEAVRGQCLRALQRLRTLLGNQFTDLATQ
jgi:DNA-directed RNA polymerase specialized sigma24 family protein